MATSTAPDGSEDVSDFLKRIQNLGDEPTSLSGPTELEQEILEGRREREARRAERARSLSPDKQQSPASTPIRSSVASPDPLSRPILSPSRNLNSRPLTSDFASPKPVGIISSESPRIPPSSAPRSGHLSWQQRPTSQSASQGRPNSTISSQPLMEASETAGRAGESVARADIAKSLGQKDPAWFRQTADRAAGSSALRRDQQEHDPTAAAGLTRHRLHGLSENSSGADSAPLSPERPTASTLALSNVVEMSENQPAKPQEQDDFAPIAGRFAAPASPTKGTGGFVQSAMMRRSESVNKRWSHQAKSSISRQNSMAGFRGNQPVGQLDSGTELSSRTNENDSAEGAESSGRAPGEPIEPSTWTPRRSRSPTKASIDDTGALPERTPSHSPQKRWSPVKASWLESALNKPPESPRSRPTPSHSSQPSWLSDLQKNRQSKPAQDTSASADLQSPTPETTLAEKAKVQYKTATHPETITPPAAKPKPPRLSGDSTSAQSPNVGNKVQQDEKKETTSTHTKAASSANIKSSAASAKDSIRNVPPPRPASVQTGQKDLEFQNAFGKLRKTQTQNYVAPDELKHNIMRGKAGLSITGGPQKSERRDEFKESILQKKASMKEKAADPASTPSRPSSTDRKPPTPEAIARRRNMTGSHTPKSSSSSISDRPPSVLSSSAARPQSSITSAPDRPQRPSSALKETPQSPILSNGDRPRSTIQKPKSPTLSPVTSPEVGIVRRGTGTNDSDGGIVDSTKAGISSKLAGRFNPALANMIARGPPTAPKEQSPSAVSTLQVSKQSDGPSAESTPGQLDHMTKGRARGPKRRPPKASPVAESAAKSVPVVAPAAAAGPIVSKEEASQSKPSTPSKPASLDSKVRGSPWGRPLEEKSTTLPISLALSPNPMKAAAPFEKGQNQSEATSADTTGFSGVRAATARWGQPTPKDAAASPKPFTTLPSVDKIASVDVPAQKTFAPSPKADAPSKAQEQATKSIALQAAVRDKAQDTPQKDEKPKLPAKSSTLQNLSASRANGVIAESGGSSRTASQELNQAQQLSPRSQTSDATQILAGFFDTFPKAPASLEVDVSAILSSAARKNDASFRTIDIELSIIGEDGQRTAVPFAQQPVLYDDAMYICKHVMKDTTGGQRVEVYLWKGKAVSEAGAYDAEVFCKKISKDAGGSFVSVDQGKEPANFFRALGDMVIFRQGRPQSKDSYMLCGRTHLSQFVAFDEVPFALNSFCSGFPYIVGDDKTHDVYLWKGNGCGPDELANAQMTSMNLSKSGKVKEIKEGSEPAAFLDLFPMPSGKKPVKAIPRSAEHWKRKAQQSNYTTRLFEISHNDKKDSSRPDSRSGPSSPGAALWNLMNRRGSQQDVNAGSAQRVKEISPYCQRDLDRNKVYVLDAFYEIYVIVGPDSKDRASSFATALVFAQDYSILAAGQQDRPFVPVGTVVMQGAPRDLKACFRGWDEERGLFGAGAGPTTPSGKSLRLVPLSAAVVAVTKAP